MEDLIYYLLLPFLFFIIFRFYSSKQNHNSPPSPRPLPIIGHLHLIKNPFHLSLTSLASRYGPIFSLQLGRKSLVVVSSAAIIDECFTKNDVALANRPKTVAGDNLTYKYSAFVFSPYGDLWKTLRRLSVAEVLSSQSLQKSAEIREEYMRILSRALYRRCKDGWQKVDLNYLISAFTFNNMMKIMAGRWCVEEEDVWREVGKETVDRIRGTFFSNFSLAFCDFFPVLRWIGYKGEEKNMMLLQKKRDEFLQSLFDEVRGKNDVFTEKKKQNLIETLLSLQKKEPEFYTEEVIKSVLLVMIIAGTETSAVSIEWTMALLISHPEELQRLRQEIDTKVGHRRLINDSDLSNLPYLRCVVNESLRLYPVAPLLLPHCSAEDCIVGGYNIPKDTMLLVNAWASQRDPNVWQEPHKFHPERFKAADSEKDGKFVPFGLGRRACAGNSMGLKSVSIAVGTFVQCFEWKKEFENEDILAANFDSQVMLTTSKPLEAMCIPRDEARDLLSQL